MLAVEEFSLDCLQAQCQNAFPKMNLAPPFVHLEILSAQIPLKNLEEKVNFEKGGEKCIDKPISISHS